MKARRGRFFFGWPLEASRKELIVLTMTGVFYRRFCEEW